MKSLDNKDLERFAWDKMAPKIEEKIKEKEKKRSFFFFRIFGLGLIFLALGTAFWLTTDNGIVSSDEGLSKNSSEFPIKINNNSSSKQIEGKTIESADLGPQINLDLTNEEKNAAKKGKVEQRLFGGLVKNDKGLSNSNVIDNGAVYETSKIDTKNNSNHVISDSKDSYSQTDETGKNIKINNTSNQLVSVISAKNPIRKKVLFNDEAESQASTDRYASAVPTTTQQTNFVFEESEKKQIAIIETDPIDQLGLNKLKTKYTSQVVFLPIVHINSKNGRLKNAIELSFNINSLQKHPHNSQIGIGYTLGYWLYVTKNQYAGFEYNFQEVRYQFVYPPEFGGPNSQKVSNNTHSLYNIPIFYGYQFQKLKTNVSIETGVNLTILMISEGEINSVTNNAAIFKIENENYFRQEVGASFLLRAKVDYALGLNYGLFARIGTNMSVTNWYKNDSYQIKPIILSLDLGLRRSF